MAYFSLGNDLRAKAIVRVLSFNGVIAPYTKICAAWIQREYEFDAVGASSSAIC
jgi:hypothetical protein